MTLLQPTRVLLAIGLAALLAACAGTAEPQGPTIARTRAPQAVEQTINNYFAFKVRNAPKNARIIVGQPAPSECALDGYVNSMRGWVVPVSYETRTGEIGRETVQITVRPYYFWFLGDTIAGITTRNDSCPGASTAFADLAPAARGAAPPLPPPAVTPVVAPAPADAARRPEAAARRPEAAAPARDVTRPAATVTKAKSKTKSRKRSAARPATAAQPQS